MRTISNLLLCLIFCTTLVQGQSHKDFRIQLRSGAIELPENFKSGTGYGMYTADEVINGYYHRIVQFYKIPTAQERVAIEQKGAYFLEYLTYGAYLMQISKDFDFQALQILQPRSISPVLAAWKTAPNLTQTPYGEWAVVGDELEVNLQVFPAISIDQAKLLCAGVDIRILKAGNSNGFLKVLVPKARIMEIAALPFVKYMELTPPPGQPEDVNGRAILRSNVINSDAPGGMHFDGSGLAVLTRDDGIVGTHIDFQGRIFNLTVDVDGTHGDGVSGIMAGAGNLNPNNKGMASGADLYVVDYVNDFQDQTLPLHLNNGVKVTNSSYSDGCNAGYTLATQTVDKQLFENPTLMHVFSAGNSNGGDCGYGAGSQWGNITGGHKMAKNSIATANLYPNLSLVESSSRGPAFDGRIKPDIASHGEGQISTDEDNTYQTFGGTSAAAPGIAGTFAQLIHAYRTFNGGSEAPTALVKATILNTANDMGNPGPDFKYGWGHLNALKAVKALEAHRYTEADVDQDGNIAHVLTIPANVRQAKVMIYWAEKESSEMTTKALLNDLDLTCIGPDGTAYLPWAPNSTPNIATLDLPAVPGVDSLNNMEQIAFNNPIGGDYTFTIRGKEVPFGPQHFYIVWEFLTDEVTLTYPSGGEGLVPGETAVIHWDAFGEIDVFNLSFSADGGNSWGNIGVAGLTERTYSWPVPTNIATGQGLIRVARGAVSDTNDNPFSIVKMPSALSVIRVCPDSITVGFTPAHDTLATDIYVLGAKYMQIQGSGMGNTLTFANSNTNQDKWLAMRASHPSGIAGRRTIAIYKQAGLFNCPQPLDGAIGTVLVPSGNSILSCQALTQNISVKIVNAGQNAISNFTAGYQVDNNPLITEAIPGPIDPGQEITYVFTTPVVWDFTGTAQLKIWVDLPGDNYAANDTTVLNLQVSTSANTAPYLEALEGAVFPPVGWNIENPDADLTWIKEQGVVGADGLPSSTLRMNYYNYTNRGAEDYIYLAPIDLAGISNPTLTFNLAHAGYNAQYNDGLRIEAFGGCDLNSTPVVLYEKIDPNLQNMPNQTSRFTPDAASDWIQEFVPLQQFAGQSVILRFTALNDYGNDMYIDNFEVADIVLDAPIASYVRTPDLDTICRDIPVTFTSSATGSNITYEWSFGSGATPASANTVGPHTVSYVSGGVKTVRLIVKNALGADTVTENIFIQQLATSNFTFTVAGDGSVTFLNTSTNANGFVWDFGDGNTSTELNPVHTYATSGTYSVVLTAVGNCNTITKTKTVNVVIVGTKEIASFTKMQLLPNPNNGEFSLAIQSTATEQVLVEIQDMAGKTLVSRKESIHAGANSIAFQERHLPQGMYTIKVSNENGVNALKLVIE